MNPKVKAFESKIQKNMVWFQLVENTTRELYQVCTPFMFDNGDQISIYLTQDDDGWYLTDEGWVLWECNIDYDKEYFEESNRSMIIKLCNWNGVDYKTSYYDKNNTYHSSELIKRVPEIETSEEIKGLVNPICEYLSVILSIIQRKRQMRWESRS